MTTIKNVKLNKHNDKLLGAAIFINAEYIAPFVKSEKDTLLNIEIEQTKDGIILRPVEGGL
ncbi:MAG: hypothetical protein KAR20_13820 [Candidatus Heimdallarchaeota archaeon]|nr:hypothetical protein [Candidatus Heimdallarchaeota archaeon]